MTEPAAPEKTASETDEASTRVLTHGPNPEAPYRNGGVAVWTHYLREIHEAAGMASCPLFLDAPALDRLPVPRLIKRLLGSLWCGLRVLRAPAESTTESTVVHVNTSLYPTTVLRDAPVVAAAALRGFPVLLQAHGGRLANLETGSIPDRGFQWMCEQASLLGIYPGPQWAEFEEAGYAGKMVRMYNVVPTTTPPPPSPEAPAHFLFLGRVTESKGVEDVLQSVFRLRENGRWNVRLTIAGNGDLLDDVREAVAASDHADAISVPGFVEGDELDHVRRQANAFVLPSRHQEGFPLSFLECAERGMACIVTTQSAIPEVFEAGTEFQPVHAGDTDDLYRQMKRMVDHPDWRARMGAAAREAVTACCTIEGATDRFRQIYASLQSRNESPAG